MQVEVHFAHVVVLQEVVQHVDDTVRMFPSVINKVVTQPHQQGSKKFNNS